MGMTPSPPGTLYLIPSNLAEGDVAWTVPPGVRQRIASLTRFIVEDAKSARRYLKRLATDVPLQSLSLATLNEHTRPEEIPRLAEPLLAGNDVGLLSEAGCPAVADPGARLVRHAHASGVKVVPLVGHSALLLALMASGLNGQRFAFHGYLPPETAGREHKLKELETQSRLHDQTQMVIETPYRNRALFESLVRVLRPDTLLCIAADLTGAAETIRTQPIAAWARKRPDIERRPAVFLFYAADSQTSQRSSRTRST